MTPVPELSIPPPGALLSLTEAHRAVFEIISLNLSRKRLRRIAPLGDGHPVMVLPGFMGDDSYNVALRRFLGGLNYAVHGWGLGRNLGPRGGVLEGLRARIHDLSERRRKLRIYGCLWRRHLRKSFCLEI